MCVRIVNQFNTISDQENKPQVSVGNKLYARNIYEKNPQRRFHVLACWASRNRV